MYPSYTSYIPFLLSSVTAVAVNCISKCVFIHRSGITPSVLLLLSKQPWPVKAWTPVDPWRYTVVSGTKMLAADPLSVNCEVGPPWIGLLTHRRSIGLRSGDPDWSAAIQPHMQQTAMHCAIWHLSIRTSWRCSHPVVEPSHFGPCQTRSNPYACLFFLFLNTSTLNQHVHLLLDVFHPLTGAMIKK